jgi:hypothetical protein
MVVWQRGVVLGAPAHLGATAGISPHICQALSMSLFADVSRLTPEHATILFFINFVGAYLIAKYGRSTPKGQTSTPR